MKDFKSTGVTILAVIGLFLLLVVSPNLARYGEAQKEKEEIQLDETRINSALNGLDVKIEAKNLNGVRSYLANLSASEEYLVICDGGKDGYCDLYVYVGGGSSPIPKK